jgi:hypothetical protein
MSLKHRKRKRPSKRRFIQLWSNVKRSQAYYSLGLPARCALIELLDRYNGCNNGMIGLGVRELAHEMKCSHATASRALRELDDAGLARPQTPGVWRGKRATEWCLTFLRCDATGELPTTKWTPREFHEESAKVSPRKRKPTPSSTTKAQNAKISMNGSSPSLTGEAHIDIYHSPRNLAEHDDG